MKELSVWRLGVAWTGDHPGRMMVLLFLKERASARCRWLMPVILATQEAEIRRIAVQSQPWAINSVRPYLENT
jgi:hypothetical protein